jgi:hypothetical protein
MNLRIVDEESDESLLMPRIPALHKQFFVAHAGYLVLGKA